MSQRNGWNKTSPTDHERWGDCVLTVKDCDWMDCMSSLQKSRAGLSVDDSPAETAGRELLYRGGSVVHLLLNPLDRLIQRQFACKDLGQTIAHFGIERLSKRIELQIVRLGRQFADFFQKDVHCLV